MCQAFGAALDRTAGRYGGRQITETKEQLVALQKRQANRNAGRTRSVVRGRFVTIASSMVTNCSPIEVWLASDRVMTGTISASLPWSRWPRFSFVATAPQLSRSGVAFSLLDLKVG